MIVTCEQCSTQFELDDAKVPERGVKVRCSRCKHAFFVKPPSEAGDAVERAVEDAIREDTGPGASDDGVEESDWEFNHEPADEGPDAGSDSLGGDTHPLDAQTQPHMGDELAGDVGSDLANEAVDDLLSGADTGPGPDFSSDLGSDDSMLGSAGQDLSLGAVGDGAEQGSGLDLRGAPNPLDASPSTPDSLQEADEPEPGAAGLGEDLGLGEAAAPEAPPAQRAASSEDGLGSPEDWNFFDEGESEEPAPSTARISLGRIGTVGGGAVRRPPVQVDAEPSRIAMWLVGGVNAVGWVVVAVLAAAGLYGGLGFAAGVDAPTAASAKQQVAGLEVASVRGSWIENAAAGSLYVVAGELRNPGRQALSADARLAVRLLDARGMPVQAQAAAGRRLPIERLREGSPAELRALLEQQSNAMAWQPLGPASSRRFHAVFSDVPPTAARLELVALEATAPAPDPSEAPAPQPTPSS